MLKSCAALVAAAGLVFTVACAQTDAGITTNVKTKLAADDTVKAYQIDVDTRNGVVTLSGGVEGGAAKERAVQIARGTDGVRDVVDQIRIGEVAATTGETAGNAAEKVGDAAGRAGAAITDAAITAAVKGRLLADTAVKGLKIDVDTSAGVVTLNGGVSSRVEADRAMMLARNTEGVARVVDNLKVGRY